MNVLLLWGEAKGCAAPIWMTYRQAAERGAQVRRDHQRLFRIEIEIEIENGHVAPH